MPSPAALPLFRITTRLIHGRFMCPKLKVYRTRCEFFFSRSFNRLDYFSYSSRLATQDWAIEFFFSLPYKRIFSSLYQWNKPEAATFEVFFCGSLHRAHTFYSKYTFHTCMPRLSTDSHSIHSIPCRRRRFYCWFAYCQCEFECMLILSEPGIGFF